MGASLECGALAPLWSDTKAVASYRTPRRCTIQLDALPNRLGVSTDCIQIGRKESVNGL